MATKLEQLIDTIVSSSESTHSVAICDQYIKDAGCEIVCNKLVEINSINTVDLRGNDIA